MANIAVIIFWISISWLAYMRGIWIGYDRGEKAAKRKMLEDAMKSSKW